MFLLVKIVLKYLTRKKLCALRLMTTICIYVAYQCRLATYLINNFRIYTALHYQNSLKKNNKTPTQVPPPSKKKAILYYSICLSIQCIVIPYFIYLNYFQRAYVDVDGNDIYRIVCDRNFSE